MADERIESAAMKAERRRNEQKQEEERRQAAAAVARLAEVVTEWRKLVGRSIIIQGSNGAPVEVIVKRVSDNGYVCMHVTGNTAMDNPGIWVAMANVEMLDDLGEGTPLGLSQFELAAAERALEAQAAAIATQKEPQKRAPRRKALTEPVASE